MSAWRESLKWRNPVWWLGAIVGGAGIMFIDAMGAPLWAVIVFLLVNTISTTLMRIAK